MTTEFLAVVGRYSALCFGITRTILSHSVAEDSKLPPFFVLYQNVKSTKIVMVGKGPFGLSYVNIISMFSVPEVALSQKLWYSRPWLGVMV